MKKLIFALTCLVLAVPCQARTIYVADDGSADFNTIQAAINDSNDGDTIIVADGTYTGQGNRDIDFKGLAITVRSTDPCDPNVVAATVIDCNGSSSDRHRAFYFHSGEGTDSIVSGLTITKGYGPDVGTGGPVQSRGGAILCTNASPSITHCIITGNRSGYEGGAIFCLNSGNPIISYCTVTGNSASWSGGSMYCISSNPKLTYCTFTGNSAGFYGGCITWTHQSNPMIRNCNFSNNWDQYAGCMYINNSNPIINHCIFMGNLSGSGSGAIRFYGGSNATISNCTISGNSGGYAGSIYCTSSSSPTISHCTIVGNTSSKSIGGIQSLDGCSPTVSHCIVWNNTGTEIGGGGTPAVSYSDVEGGYGGEGNIDADPCFVDPSSGDYHLLPHSPCIDAGDPCYSAVPGETDIDGEPRVIMSRVDIGADEFSCVASFIVIAPQEFEFVAYEGRTNPETQFLSIRNGGLGTLTWEVTEDCSWLEVDPSNGESTGEFNQVSVIVDISGLIADSYNCQLMISDPYAANNPRTVEVDLVVIGPILEVSAGAFEFSAYEGGANPNDQTLTISNSGGGTLNCEIIYDCNWLSVEPNSGSSTEEPNDVILSIDILGLAVGFYNCELIVSDPNAENSPQIVTVSLHVYDAEPELHVPSEYETIQSAVDAAGGGSVVVADGIYTGAGNRNINFKGKAITVLSENGPQNCIIDCEETYNTRGFIFNNGEDANSVLSGFTIKRGKTLYYGGGIYCNGSSPVIENCIIINNSVKNYNCGKSYGGGIYCESNSNPTIVWCIVRNNVVSGGGGLDFGMDGESGYGGGIFCSLDSWATIENCVVADNIAVGGNGFMMMDPVWGGDGCGGGIYGNVTINNTVIIRNTTLGGDGNYGGNGYGGGIYASSATINNGTISDNTATGGQNYPVGEGYSYGGGIYIEGGTTLTNCIFWANGATFGPEIYGSGLVLYSDIQAGYPGFGNIDADPCFADSSNDDYHLKSMAGRWDPNSESWLQDDVTSPCIDAGDPNSDWTAELWPHGKRINIGAYGGTPQASMSLSDVGKIADLNNDDSVDYVDLMLFIEKWPYHKFLLPEDLDRNGFVDFNDFALFGQQWSYLSSFEPGMTFQIDDCNMEGGLDLPSEEPNEPRFSVWVEGSYIHFEDLMYANCCPDELGLEKEINGNQITLYEIGYGGLCDCMCYFPIKATLGPFEDGTYTVEVYDNYGKLLGVVEVTIGQSSGPGITYQIEDCDQEASGVFTAEPPDLTRFTVTVDGLYIHFEDMMVANCCPDELGLEMTVEDSIITIYETEYTPGGCYCICDYPLTATLGPFEPGTYTLEVYEEWSGFIGSTTVVIDPPE